MKIEEANNNLREFASSDYDIASKENVLLYSFQVVLFDLIYNFIKDEPDAFSEGKIGFKARLNRYIRDEIRKANNDK